MYVKYEDAKLMEVHTFHDWLDHLDPDELNHLCELIDRQDATDLVELAEHFVQVLAIETPGRSYTDDEADELFVGFTTVIGIYSCICLGYLTCKRARITLVNDQSTFAMTHAGREHALNDPQVRANMVYLELSQKAESS